LKLREDVLRGAKALTLQGLVAVPVVQALLLLVGEHLVGLVDLLELLLRLGVARVAVGVILEGHLAIGLLDLLGAGAALDAKDFVVVASGDGHGRCLFSLRGRRGVRALSRRGP
jgi:hypothetical protein